MSPWINKWNSIVEKSNPGPINVNQSLQWNFIPPLGWAKDAIKKVGALKRKTIKGLQEITREDLSAVEVYYDEDVAARADMFTIGNYFDQTATKIIKGVLPCMQFD